MKYFDEDGLSFSYPDDWVLERESAEDGWTVTLQSSGTATAFAVITLDRQMPEVDQVVKITLDALKEDYPDLEAEPAMEMIAGELASGHDVAFISLDFTARCTTRCFHGGAGTVLILCQVSDLDEDDLEPAFFALRASMRSEE